MNASKAFRTVETHTLGQPTRNIVGGFPSVPGNTMAEKFIYMKEHEDWFRRLMSFEPRGNSHMSCTLVTEPCTPGTDVGVLYFGADRWYPIMGHDTLGVAVALIETGMVPVTEPVTKIKLDTAAGVIDVEAQVKDGSVKEVSYISVPSFALLTDLPLETTDYGSIHIDISWAGRLYAILPIESVGLTIGMNNSAKVIEAAQSIERDIRAKVNLNYPDLPFVQEISDVLFYSKPENPDVDIHDIAITLPNGVDRSPSGAGTSATAAVLYRKGKLHPGETFVEESVIGSCFRCEIVTETEISGFKGIIPKITGNAHIQGFATWVLDPDDPFPDGFILA